MSQHLREQWRKIASTITFEHEENGDGWMEVFVFTSGTFAGSLSYDIETGEIMDVGIYPQYQRQGLATALLGEARRLEPRVHHSHNLTEDGEAWSSKVAAPTSWRPVSGGNPTDDADCVILTQYVGTRRYFEVYTYGVAFANRPTLVEAKAAVEEIYGGLTWERRDVPKVEVVHYYYGPTDEFSDPVVIYCASLPRLGYPL